MKTQAELTSKELEQVTGGVGGGHEARVIGVLKNQLDLNNREVLRSSSIVGELGADSLDVVDLVQALEAEFKISIPDSRVLSIHTVGDLCNVIEEMQGGIL